VAETRRFTFRYYKFEIMVCRTGYWNSGMRMIGRKSLLDGLERSNGDSARDFGKFSSVGDQHPTTSL
jgi:hypothetical protein